MGFNHRAPIPSRHITLPTLTIPKSLMKAKVTVLPKQSILDPQGVAVRDAIRHHGLPGAKAARGGKMIELDLDDATTDEELHEVCRDLLSNPVIEDYVLQVER